MPNISHLKVLTHYCLTAAIVTVLPKFYLKKERIMEKISYERRIHESVDNKSLYYAIFQNLTGKGFLAVSVKEKSAYIILIVPKHKQSTRQNNQLFTSLYL